MLQEKEKKRKFLVIFPWKREVDDEDEDEASWKLSVLYKLRRIKKDIEETALSFL